MANPTFDDLATTTIRRRTKKLADNITHNNGLLTEMKDRKKGRKPAPGGISLLEELSYGDNGTFMFYQGDDLLNIKRSQTITAAEFPWSQASVAVRFNNEELLQNSGPDQMIDLVAGRTDNAMSTMKNKMTEALYSDGNGWGGKQVKGLQAAIVTENARAQGIYGGISRADNAWWRAQNVSGVTAENVLPKFRELRNRLIRNGDMTRCAFADNEMWGMIHDALQSQQRFAPVSKAKGGFETLNYMGIDIYLDGGLDGSCPANTLFMLNTDFLFYRPHTKRDFAMDEVKRIPTNQDAWIKFIWWMGQLTCSNLSLQGRLQVSANA